MKIDGIIIKDEVTNTYFTFIRQFPGICAQGGTVKEAEDKINIYFQKFIERMKDENVKMDDSQIVSMK